MARTNAALLLALILGCSLAVASADRLLLQSTGKATAPSPTDDDGAPGPINDDGKPTNDDGPAPSPTDDDGSGPSNDDGKPGTNDDGPAPSPTDDDGAPGPINDDGKPTNDDAAPVPAPNDDAADDGADEVTPGQAVAIRQESAPSPQSALSQVGSMGPAAAILAAISALVAVLA